MGGVYQSWDPSWQPQQGQPPWPPPGQQPWGRPTGPSVGWAVVLWVAAGACFAGMVLCGIMAVLGFTIDHHLDNNGVTTTATVTDVGDVNITVEFRTEDNQPATAEFTWWPEVYPEVDDRIEITYDPDDPSYAIQAGSDEDQIMGTVFAVAALLAFVAGAGASIGAVFVHRARGKAARSSGVNYYY